MALIALGSNLALAGKTPQQIVQTAISEIAAIGDIPPYQSRLFRSPAFPRGSGPDFVNGAIQVETTLSPVELLVILHAIEQGAGRVRDRRWGARSLDLDLLAMGDRVLPDAATQAHWRTLPLADQTRLTPDTLILPHPRLQDRAFVLVPLADIAPDWVHPATGQSVARMLAALPAADRDAVVPIA